MIQSIKHFCEVCASGDSLAGEVEVIDNIGIKGRGTVQIGNQFFTVLDDTNLGAGAQGAKVLGFAGGAEIDGGGRALHEVTVRCAAKDLQPFVGCRVDRRPVLACAWDIHGYRTARAGNSSLFAFRVKNDFLHPVRDSEAQHADATGEVEVEFVV